MNDNDDYPVQFFAPFNRKKILNLLAGGPLDHVILCHCHVPDIEVRNLGLRSAATRACGVVASAPTQVDSREKIVRDLDVGHAGVCEVEVGGVTIL